MNRKPSAAVDARDDDPPEWLEDAPPRGDDDAPPTAYVGPTRLPVPVIASLAESGAVESDHAADAWTSLRPPYRMTARGIEVAQPRARGGEPDWRPVTNFACRIVAHVTDDDGTDKRRFLRLRAFTSGRVQTADVPVSEFAEMHWPITVFGPAATVFAKRREDARAAIQLLSGAPHEETRYTHLGWRLIDGRNVYLHAAGAIDGNGAVPDIQAFLSDDKLALFALPAPPDGAQLRAAAEAVCDLANVAVPVLAALVVLAPFRAVLGPADFVLWLYGTSGAGKSCVAALAQQFFAPRCEFRNLPGNWSSTETALEFQAYTAKDALFAVDDFAPAGAVADVDRLHAKAARLVRNTANHAGRARGRADGTANAGKPPRCLVLVTAEDRLRGHSLNARCMFAPVARSQIDWVRLTVCQGHGASGRLAAAMAAFVQWIAPQLGEIQARHAATASEHRPSYAAKAQHSRVAPQIADLHATVDIVIDFLRFAGIDAERLLQVAFTLRRGVADLQPLQGEATTESRPDERFIELVRQAIAAGHAHVCDSDGRQPGAALSWGWREERNLADTAVIRARGDCVGFLTESALYLLPDAAIKAGNRAVGDGGTGVRVQPPVLSRALNEAGWLVASEAQRWWVRRKLAGQQQKVLAIDLGRFLGAGDPD